MTKRAGRYGEDYDDENARPFNLGLEAARYASNGDLQPTSGRRTDPGREQTNNHQAPTNTVEQLSAPKQKHPDRLTQELLRMHEQQELEQQLLQMQLQHQHNMYGGLLPDPGPPPTTVYCLRSRSNSTVSDISFKEREWVDDPSMASSTSAQEHMVLAEDWEGFILHDAMRSRENSLEGAAINDRVTPGSRSPTLSDATAGPEVAEDSSPMVPSTHKGITVPQEFSVWNPNAAIPTVLRDGHKSLLEVALERKPSAVDVDQKHSNDSDNQRSVYCSMEETNQTYQQLHVYGEVALPKPSNKTNPPNPPLRMEELRIDGLTEHEMIRLAVEQSMREEEERQRLTSAFVIEEDIAMKPLQGYSLEKLMEMPRPERTPTHSAPKAKGMQRVRNMLGLRRGI
jgi:hypothetical protein